MDFGKFLQKLSAAWFLTLAGYVLVSLVIQGAMVCDGFAAQPQLFGSNGLDASFCRDKTFRRTVVYVDYDSVRTGHEVWAENLENKLRATLAPGERVTVVELFPKTGTSRRLWSACWPNFTAAQRSTLRRKTFIFSSNPLNQIRQQQGFFFNGFGAAITQIFLARAKDLKGSVGSGSKSTHSEILESLASDGARFSQTTKLIRAIVYTDGAQDSDLGSVTSSPPKLANNAGKALGTYFHNSIFYFFGIRNPGNNDSDYLANSRQFWSGALSSMETVLVGYGSALSIPNSVPSGEHRYRIRLTRKNLKLSGSMVLLTDQSDNLVDSFISVNRLGVVALNGHFECGTAPNRDCSLRASTNRGLVTTDTSETVSMKTSGSDGVLKGSIGVPGTMTFPLVATASHTS